MSEHFNPKAGAESFPDRNDDRKIDELLPNWNPNLPTEIVFIRDEDESPLDNQNASENDPLLKEWEEWKELIFSADLEVAQKLFDAHPEAFLAYLGRFYLKTPRIYDLEEDFSYSYVGSYNTPEDWAEEAFQILDWKEAQVKAEYSAGIPKGILKLDTAEFLTWATESMGFVVLKGKTQVHVFEA